MNSISMDEWNRLEKEYKDEQSKKRRDLVARNKQIQTDDALSKLNPQIKKMLVSFMVAYDIPIKLDAGLNYALDFKDQSSNKPIIRGLANRTQVLNSLMGNDFDLEKFILSFSRWIKKYYACLKINVRSRVQIITVGLKKNYTSLSDIDYIEIRYYLTLNYGSNNYLDIRFYLHEIESLFHIEEIIDRHAKYKIAAQLYYKDFDSLLPVFINQYKERFEQMLGYSLGIIDKTTAEVVKMIIE